MVALIMKVLILLAFCCASHVAGQSVLDEGVEANECTPDICKAEDGCICATSTSPLNSEEIPQLVSITFEEIVTDALFNDFLKPLFFERLNPDKKPIGITLFVPHEYTDYQRVNDLYNHGFEIGVNSITKSALATYWPLATEELLEKEFGGQKKILHKFAKIPEEDILGARTPYLQMAGNNTFQAYQTVGLLYDNSWPTSSDKPLFPYTLDYLSTQQCRTWERCPNESFKGFWVLPINELRGYENQTCNNLVACNVTGTADEIGDWLMNEINVIRNGSRVPLTLMMNSYWFEFTKNSREGFIKFLDKLVDYDDVFLVTQKQVVEWMRNPVPLTKFKTDHQERNASCTPNNCKLQKPDGSIRYLYSCVPCPAVYPWLNNPDGNLP